MKRSIVALSMVLVVVTGVWGGGAQASASSERGYYLAEQGIISPPEEIVTDSYIASIDYEYPLPKDDLALYLYSSTRQVSSAGQEMILHIGIQGAKKDFDSLPAMNLVYVVDASSSMNDEDKMAWVKEGLEIFLKNVRNRDFLSLVVFSDKAEVVIPSTRMNTQAKREEFRQAVANIEPAGGSNIEAGLSLGYEQILANYRREYINRVLFISDGTEFSSRLNTAGGQTGDIRVTLIWDNHNDLDLHVTNPRREEIYYGHKQSREGGFLDVDANAGGSRTNKPVENVFWPDNSAPAGTYEVEVVNFAYHTVPRAQANYRLEVKNGDELSYFEGTTSRLSERIPICTFEYKTSSAVRREKALIYELASEYKELGINISTIGVGVTFDLQMMNQLAREGGGSSRFISDHDEMEKIFGSEFDRMAVPIARNLRLSFGFSADAEVISTWGYDHRITPSTVSWFQPTLHLGDYETILLRYRLGELTEEGYFTIGHLSGSYTDEAGVVKRIGPIEHGAVALSGDVPLSGISDGMVLRSGSMMLFAETLKEIGETYYAAVEAINGGAGEESVRDDLQDALDLTLAMKRQLANARTRLDRDDYFVDQIAILDSYADIIGENLGMESAAISNAKDDLEIDPAATMKALESRVYDLCNEIVLGLDTEGRQPVAISGFSSKDGVRYPLIDILEETASIFFARRDDIEVIERDRLRAIVEEQKLTLTGLVDTESAIEVGKLLSARYMVTGTVIPMRNSVVIFGRLIDVESSEIVNAAQVIVARQDLGDLLDD